MQVVSWNIIIAFYKLLTKQIKWKFNSYLIHTVAKWIMLKKEATTFLQHSKIKGHFLNFQNILWIFSCFNYTANHNKWSVFAQKTLKHLTATVLRNFSINVCMRILWYLPVEPYPRKSDLVLIIFGIVPICFLAYCAKRVYARVVPILHELITLTLVRCGAAHSRSILYQCLVIYRNINLTRHSRYDVISKDEHIFHLIWAILIFTVFGNGNSH